MPNAVRSFSTKYNGITYRSFHEARWAVLFDALGIPFEYEPEALFLEHGPYIPDFRLWGSLCVEVKPLLQDVEELAEQYQKVIDRTRGLDEILILAGRPQAIWYPVLSASMPCGFRWIDLERSSRKGAPVCLAGSRRPPVEDLAWPRSRFDEAVYVANHTHNVEAA